MDSHEKQSPQRFGRYAAMLIMLLTLGVGQMWADITYSGGYIYFDNSLGINDNTLQICARQGSWTGVSSLSNISNTKLYYVANPQGSGWGGILGWVVISANPAKSNSNFDNWSSYTWCSDWNTYGFNSGSTYLIVPSSTSKSESVTTTYYSGGYSALNSTQTINTVVKTGSGSYTSANSKATISITSYAMTGDGEVTKQTTSISTSAKTQTVSAARTATTTYTVGDVASGYQFDGWYTAATGGTQLSSSTTYTYYPTAATTVYARFSEKMSTVTLSASPSGKGSFTIGGAAATSTTAGVTTTRSVTAVPISGYHFVSWSITGGASISSTTTNPTTITGGGAGTAATLTATFEADAVNSLTVAAGTHVTTVTGSTSPVTLGNKYAINATAFETGWQFLNWTATPAANGTFDNASSASTNVTVKNGSVVVTANAQEKMTTVTVNVSPTGTGTLTVGGAAFTPGNTTTAGVSTSRAVVATAANDYAFSSWSVTGNATGTSSTNTYTLKGNGSAGTGTLTANFTALPCSLMYGSSTPLNSPTSVAMTYDATEHAYYKDITTTSPFYFRFSHNDGKQYCGDWTSYPDVNAVTANDSKVACATETQGWDNKGSLKYIGESGTTIRIWFDYQNKQTWITADKDKQYVLRGANADDPSAAHGMPGWDATTSYFVGLASGNTGTISCSLNAGEWYHLKVYDMYNKTWYGTSTSGAKELTDGTLSTMGSYDDFYFGATIADSYTFTLDKSSGMKIKVDYPVSYQLNYDIGTVKGNNGSISTDPSTASGSYIPSGNTVTLTAPAAKAGYSWEGWYTNAAGTEGKIPDTDRAITVTMNADKTLYACYTEDMHTVTVTTDGHGTITTPASGTPRTVSAGIATGGSIAVSASTGYTFYNWTKTSGSGTVTFTDANAASTTVKSTSDATVRANFVDMWNVKGSWDSWSDYTPMTATGVSNTYGTTKTLAAKTEYHIKVVKRVDSNSSNDKWYGVNGGTTLSRATGSVTGLEENGGETEYITFTTDAAGDYTITYLYNASAGSMKVTVGYPTAYTVTFGKGTGGGTITASATSAGGSFTSGDYVASGDDVTFTQTASSSGYNFAGWYTTKDTGGSAVTGMGVSDNVLENVTANKTVWSRYTANNYTVTFDATTNGGTCATASKSVTFDAAYGELPVATHASRQFVGWYTTASDDPTPGTRVTAETIVSNPSNHTLYARFESTFEVTVTYKCGSDVLYPSNKVYASASSLAADISAPEILGYRFVNWTGSNATFGDASSATTTVNASALTTITANYEVVPTVYFKNNLGWDSVFVTFDCSFIAGKQNVPSNNGHPYFAMTQLGSTDIFYCEIPSTYTSSDYAEWAWNIAFDNTNYGKTATTTHTGTWDFYGGECVGRGDFDPKATMFIPFNGDTETRNTATFYKTGCWMKYNSTDPGYQVKVNQWVTGANSDTCTVSLSAPVAGGYEFSGKVWLKAAGYGYGFKLYKPYLKNTNDLWYSNNGSIHSNTTTLPWEFATKIIVDEVEQAVTADTRRCELYTEAKGDYEFTVSFATGKPVVNVTYPVSAGDYRLVYNDNATWSNDAHDASWIHPSRVIKAKANAEDIVSFYIAYGSSPSILLQKCTSIDGSGNPVWNAGTSVTIGATAKGIYNYKVTQDGSKNATVTFDGSYNGNFYVRTDVSDGGWSNYKTSGTNTMTYSEYAEDNYDFTHYFMRFVNKGLNIKFCIANDYSECISDTLVSDSYTNEWIEAYANVRFMWDHRTNKISRAYISGSSNISDRFLVLEGSTMMYDEDGNALTGVHQISGLEANEMKFIDDQNWIYEATIKANPKAKALLTAKYNGKIQYFGGSGPLITDSVLLIGGSDANKYKIRVVYDFKTNRLLKAFIPDGAITSDLAIETDLMIIRDHQEDAKQVTFDGGSLSKVKTVYGAMMFNKWTVNNKHRSTHETLSLSRYERDLFYISFPFDVKLSDVFGFGTYGKHWILEYYDGKTRAANGFWADSDPNWKFVMPSQRHDFTMKAFEGYILALDLDELTESSSVWNNNVENVYIYFPSTVEVKDIQATNRLVTIDQDGYECTINRPTPDGDRRVKDSYWHCIGVPSFANYSSTLYDDEEGTAIDWSDTNTDSDGDQWTTPNLPYLYEVDLRDKSLSVTSTNPFHFKATWSYLVQYQKSSIYWSNVNVTPAPIVARRSYQEAPTNAEFRIELQQAGEKADQTFVRLTNDEAVTTGFDFNYDLSKEFNKNKANIYTMVTTVKEDGPSITEVAGNVQPMTEQTTVVPMGVTIAKAGEYTISIPSGTSGIGVTLVDNETGIRTNLALEDYAVALEAGTQNDRFYLEISPIKHVATGVEEITGDGSQVTGARKVMVDGILYIIKDGKVFSTQGARVK